MAKKKDENEDKIVEKKENKDFIHAHGRRKTATARIRLYTKGGEFSVNGMSIEEYFPGQIAKTKYQSPLIITNTLGKMSASFKVSGSGKNSQLGAVIHALSRALINVNPDFRAKLKPHNLLTRDPRAKERRKYGLAQKARKGKQSPKR